MPNVVLFPAAGRSIPNFRRTVITPVLLDDAQRFLDAGDLEAIRAAHPDGSAPMWGAWTGSDDRFVHKWRRLQPEDLVAFSGGGGLVATAVVTHKMRSPSLASHIWDDLVRPDGVFPYELMLTMRDLRDVFVPYEDVRNAIASWGPRATVREMNFYDAGDAVNLAALLGGGRVPRSRMAARPPREPVEIPVEQSSVTSYETQRSGEAYPPSLRRESELVEAYNAWLVAAGHETCRHRVPQSEGGDLYTDLYNKTTSELVEAKASARRESVRMGLGQLLDYARSVQHDRMALLLPERPAEDLVQLLNRYGVSTVWREGRRFVRDDVAAVTRG